MLVKIWTDSFIITGEIDTLRDERLTDYIRENKDFIAGQRQEREGPVPYALPEREHPPHRNYFTSGIVGVSHYKKRPLCERSNFVFNANGSFCLNANGLFSIT